MMKFILIVCTLCLCTTATTYAQEKDTGTTKSEVPPKLEQETVETLEEEKNKFLKNNIKTGDLLNPINFTKIIVREPSGDGKSKSIELPNRSTFHYIKPVSNIHLEFNRAFVEVLTQKNLLNIRIAAVIKRKDGTIKPLSASGLTEVIPLEKTSLDKYKAMTTAKDENSSGGSESISDEFKVVYKNSSAHTLSTEINLAFEDIGEDDVIVISVINTKANNVDYTFSLGFFDNIWKATPTGGFSFIKTFNNGDRNFHAGGSTGVAFQKHLKPTQSFWGRFFNPSFGPEINVLQDDDAKTIVGFGGFITSFMNTVKFGVGLNLNDGKNEPYLSIGLNFVEGISTITETANRAK